jgi:hypothetical protein
LAIYIAFFKAKGVNKPCRIILYIRIKINPTPKPNRIFSNKPTCSGVVVPVPIVIKPRLPVQLSSCKEEVVVCLACLASDLSKDVVGGGGCGDAFFISEASCGA